MKKSIKINNIFLMNATFFFLISPNNRLTAYYIIL